MFCASPTESIIRRENSREKASFGVSLRLHRRLGQAGEDGSQGLAQRIHRRALTATAAGRIKIQQAKGDLDCGDFPQAKSAMYSFGMS